MGDSEMVTYIEPYNLLSPLLQGETASRLLCVSLSGSSRHVLSRLSTLLSY